MITRELHIGKLALGGANPVRIQSMTNTNTADTEATVKQTLALVDAGCEMVRITARNKAEAENLRIIKSELLLRGCDVPLIADIHFQPEAAEIAARYVHKVRINPGNYVDKQASTGLNYTESAYQQELDKISTRLLPLISICKDYGTAIRVGVNHGSLSARITERYGDTPEGMVVSALEFIAMFVGHEFHNLVLSMKSSNVKTMIYSYRLLAARMTALGYDYPLHLGVTEAGAGADARIKSAAGIGELLMEGLGDTLRVSLTENPVNEIAVAKQLCAQLASYRTLSDNVFHQGYSFNKADTVAVNGIGSMYPPATITTQQTPAAATKFAPDYYYDMQNGTLKRFSDASNVEYVLIDAADFNPASTTLDERKIILYDISACADLHDARRKLFAWKALGNRQPLVLYKKYLHQNEDTLTLVASAEFAFFLTDGLINGICIDAPHHPSVSDLMFALWQAMGLRRVKAEFIACPTCGRTSYDVEGTLKKLSERLSHLKHLKIGVMGCIVNGPGEMADADYGYVGSGMQKVNLYKGKNLVHKNIDESIALDELIQLIKENGDWEEA